jgi:hypothetical protein
MKTFLNILYANLDAIILKYPIIHHHELIFYYENKLINPLEKTNMTKINFSMIPIINKNDLIVTKTYTPVTINNYFMQTPKRKTNNRSIQLNFVDNKWSSFSIGKTT